MTTHKQCVYCDARADSTLCEVCRQILGRYRFPHTGGRPVAEPPLSAASFAALAEECALEYGVRVGEMLVKTVEYRTNLTCFSARQRLYQRMMEMGFGTSTIGRWVKRDHSTVHHALKKATHAK